MTCFIFVILISNKSYPTELQINMANFFDTYYKIVSVYDQEIIQSQTADNPMAPQGRATQQSRDTRKTN